MRLITILEKSKSFWFLLVTSFLFFLLRFPSLFEPYWYEEEGITQVVGMALRSGKLLYKDIVDNKPPLLYLLYSAFDSDQFSLKLLSLIFGFLAVIAFLFLTKKLFSKSSFILALIFIVLFGLPIIEGNIANAENFMLFPIILAAFLITNTIVFHSHLPPKSFRLPLFTAGILVGVAFLFKAVSFFDFIAFLLFLFFANYSHKFLKKLLLFFSAGFLLPLGITTFYLLINGNFVDFLEVAIQNVSYLGQGNKILTTQFIFLAQVILLAAFLIFIFRERKKLSKATLFVFIWFAFSLFNAFLSPRHHTHHLLVLLPSFLLLIQLIFWDKKYQKLSIAFLIISTILIFKNFSFYFYGNIINYYQNLVFFVAGKKSASDYQAFFDSKTQVDYKLAQFIKSKNTKGGSIFVWGNNAQLYKMTNTLPPGKYSAAHHITYYKDGFENTRQALEKTKPRFIIIMPNQPSPPFSLINYSEKVNFDSVRVYEKVF